jgi:predicted RND superfamily exporter protein
LIIGGDLVRGMLNGLLAVVSLAIAVVCFIYYRQDASTLLIVLTIIFAVLMVVFGGMFLSGRVNKTEDIHITE